MRNQKQLRTNAYIWQHSQPVSTNEGARMSWLSQKLEDTAHTIRCWLNCVDF